MVRRFVLLDRDGTVIVHVPYLSDPAQVELAPGAGPALRSLQEAGLGLALVSNQSGVGRGMFGLEAVESVNQRMKELLAGAGVRLDGVYFCPHAPQEGCACRKPGTGMAEQAARELGFDPRTAFVVGDAACDQELGRALGATTFLIVEKPHEPDEVASLAEACRRILEAL